MGWDDEGGLERLSSSKCRAENHNLRLPNISSKNTNSGKEVKERNELWSRERNDRGTEPDSTNYIMGGRDKVDGWDVPFLLVIE